MLTKQIWPNIVQIGFKVFYMNKRIFGREKEIAILEDIWASKEPELVAIYGRRRVGKTFLVREFFSNKGIYCEIFGLKNGSLKEQLENFSEGFSKTFYKGMPLKPPANWREALNLLTKEIEGIFPNKKVVLFLDELPWMATPRSGLLQNLDYFWNTKWSRLPNLKIVVCGSAASWILEHLINAKGGLHNRITKTVLLEPFSLYETKMFLKKRTINLNDRQVLDIYMAMGGIPHYLKQVRKGMSAAQNINEICFHKDGLLYDEFPRIFKSLFDESEIYLSIIGAISKNREGVDRNSLLKQVGAHSGGRFNKRLEELESAGFIQCFVPYGKKVKDQYYRIIDEYTLFYLTWIEPFKNSRLRGKSSVYWNNKINSGSWLNWAGITFENICYKHIEQIRKALKLNDIGCEIGGWRYIPSKGVKEHGAQIDLLFDRDDNVVSICEIKYCQDQFVIDKAYAGNLINKMNTFEKHFQKNKQIMLHMITTFGMKKNMWSKDLIHMDISLSDIMAF